MRLIYSVVVALAGLAVAGCGPAVEGESPRAAGAWRQLPDPPLAPRDHAVVVGVGERMLVVGGWEFLCPPDADCSAPDSPRFADGAVYDPAADSWTATAPAPFGLVREEYATASIGETAWLLTGCQDGRSVCDAHPRLLSYDLDADRWTDHGAVPGKKAYRHLVAVGRHLLAYSGSDEHGERPDAHFDPRTSTWSELPDDPLPGTFDRYVVPVGDQQLVLAASSAAALERGQDAGKLVARFDLDAGRWTRLPDAPGEGYQLLPSDRGPLLNGHFIGAPGWLLDPDTWTWSELPEGAGEGHDLNGVLDGDRAVYDIPNSVGQMASGNRLLIYDSQKQGFLTIPALPEREDVYDDSSTALGRDLFVYGGQRWTVGAQGSASDGELVGDAWLWTAPGD